MDALRNVVEGPQTLANCSGRMDWPIRGVYFFYEAGEERRESGSGPRVVRIGTHALKAGSGTTLWNRLAQHRGLTNSGGGNHRGSIFRLLVGTALMARSRLDYPTWGAGSSADRRTRQGELPLERLVSDHIRQMPFLWLSVLDDAGESSQRGHIERNSIALLSNYGKPPIDPPSAGWLGLWCPRERVRESGLWNQNHVDGTYDPGFMDVLEARVAAMKVQV